MKLELHDAEVANSLVAGVRDIDYDYQAEQWVLDTQDHSTVVRWVLIDDVGERCVWERASDDTGSPRITRRSERFAGQWQDEPAQAAAS